MSNEHQDTGTGAAGTGAENWLRELEAKLLDQGNRLTAIEEHITKAPADLTSRVAAIEERLSDSDLPARVAVLEAENTTGGTGDTHALALAQVYKILAAKFPNDTAELHALLHQ
jgi:hypothetical protein